MRNYGKVSFQAGKLCLTDEQEERYMEWNRGLRSAIEARSKQPRPLEAGVQEERLNRWLEQRKVAEPWSIAPVFAEAGIEPQELTPLDEFLDRDATNIARATSLLRSALSA